jgi:hypothetical protein
VLEDGHCRAVRRREVADQLERGLRVHQVVVRERLAVQRLGNLEEAPVESGALVGILAVAQRRRALELHRQTRREGIL